MRMYNPAHPGQILQEYLGQQDVTSFAERIGVARTTLSRILNGHAGISAQMAVRLSEVLKTTPEIWMNLQVQYDLWHALQARKAERRAAREQAQSPQPAPRASERTERMRKAA